MAKPPKRIEVIIDESGLATRRLSTFFESIPDAASPISNISTGSSNPEILAVEEKINEILSKLRTSKAVES